MSLNKKRIKRFVKRYFIGLIIFMPLIISLDFYVEELSNEDIQIRDIPNTTLTNHLGESFSISDLKGKIVLIDFWFAHCEPCINEMSYFSELFKKYPNKFSIISFSSDSKEMTLRILNSNDKKWNFLDANNPNWHFCNRSFLKQEKSLINSLNVTYFPTYYLLDENGVLISKPYSGIYAIEKQLGGPLAIKITLKKYLSHFESHKIYIPLVAYNIIVLLIIMFQFIFFFLKKISN